MKPLLVIAFFGAFGHNVEKNDLSLINSSQYTPSIIPNSTRTVLLSEQAKQRFVPLNSSHVSEIEILIKGIKSNEDENVWFAQTHAWIKTPAVIETRESFKHEHWSLTNSSALPGIITLIEKTILPKARIQCPDLADEEAYPLYIIHTESAGLINRKQAVARLVVPSVIEGLPTIQCNVKDDNPPAEDIEGVRQMIELMTIPVVKAETGLR